MNTVQPTKAPPRQDRWQPNARAATAVRVFSFVFPIVVSVAFVAMVSRVVTRPSDLLGTAAWWVGLTAAASVVLVAVERLMRRLLPLETYLRMSLAFPDQAPSKFKAALRTNTLRQLQRDMDEGALPSSVDGHQEAAEKLLALASALNDHDRLTRGHTERVRAYSLMIGEEMGLPQEDLDKLHWAGLVHDIGKITVPPEILNKKGRPDEKEWKILQQHPAAGHRLVEPLRPWLGEWADAASQHHERMDGAGYPFGLDGSQISLAGKIVAVADAFDVMTSVRSYKKAMPAEEARAELVRCAGTQFDPVVVRAFLGISIGRLRLVMGPLSWLAQLPWLAGVPIGPGLATGVSVGLAMAASILGGWAGTEAPPAATEMAAPSAVIVPIAFTGVEDTELMIGRPASLPDDVVGWRVTLPPEGATVRGSGDDLRLMPDPDVNGRMSGRYEACWEERCATSSLDVMIEPVNDFPETRPDEASVAEDDAITLDPAANDTDVEDGRPVVRSVSPTATLASADGRSLVGGAVGLGGDGRVSFQPPPGTS